MKRIVCAPTPPPERDRSDAIVLEAVILKSHGDKGQSTQICRLERSLKVFRKCRAVMSVCEGLGKGATIMEHNIKIWAGGIGGSEIVKVWEGEQFRRSRYYLTKATIEVVNKCD